MVKADAYGLGAARVIPALWAAGCRSFFVATPEEARDARALAPAAAIYVLDGLVPRTGARISTELGAIPVLSSLEEVARLGRRSRASAQRRCPPRCTSTPASTGSGFRKPTSRRALAASQRCCAGSSLASS